MSQHILLRGARQVLTLHGSQDVRRGTALQELSVISDGSVLVNEDVIKCVGSTRRVENLKEARDALEIDVHGCVVMPGFIDPGLSVSAERTENARSRAKKPREIYDENLELLRGCLQLGTLSVGIKASELNGFGSVLPLLRQLEKIGDNPVAMKRTWKLARPPEFEDELRDFRATIDALRRRKLLHFLEVSAGTLVSSGTAFLSGPELSGIPLKIDCSQAPLQVMEEALRRVQAAGLICSTWIGEVEAQIAAAFGRVVVFSPGGDIAEACGPGMRHFIDAGGAIALTSGYCARTAPCFSMQMAIARAVGLGGLSVEEAIAASTVNAAYALGQGAATGTIEAGKRADLTVLAVPDYRELPRHFGSNQVRLSLRAGQVAYNRGRWKIGAHAQGSSDGGMRSEPLRGAGL